MQSPGQRREADPASGVSGDGPTLKVAAVARRLGVAPATLRTWARRYGVGPPAHTAGAHRQYTADDLSRLLVMRRLTLEGVAPAEAARIALSSPAVESAPAVSAPGGGLSLLPPLRAEEVDVQPAATAAAGPVHSRPLRIPSGMRPGPGWAEAPQPPEPQPTDLFGDLAEVDGDTRRLLVAARDLDQATCRALLLDSLREGGVVQMWDGLAVPALRVASDHLAATGRSGEVQLALTSALLAVVSSVHVTAPEPAWGTAVLACAQGDQHSLPLHALGAALAERRVGSLVLGADVPHAGVVVAAERTRAKIVLLYAASPVGQEQLDALPALEQTTRLLVAGPGWHDLPVPDGAVHAPSLPAAVDQIRLAVRH